MNLDYVIEDFVSDGYKIEKCVIEGLKRPRFVTIQNETVVDYLFAYCIKMMDYARSRHESREMAYAINLNTLEFIGAEFGDARSVNISALVDKIDASECIFIVMHNHPGNGPFSPRDLNTFISVPNMAILMVIGNKGSIHIIEKTDKSVLDDHSLEIRKTLIAYRLGKCSFNDSICELERYGVVYTSL